MLQSPLKGESAGLETSDAKGTLLDLRTGCIDQEQDVISQLSFQQGEGLPKSAKSRYYLGGRVGFGSVFPGHVPCGKRVTVGYRFPLGPHFGEPFGVLGRGADVCEKGEGVLAQIGKVRVKAPFATAVDVGGGRTKVARLEGLCRAL